MPDILSPILYGLFVWWASTGGALYVVGLAERAPHAVLAGSLLLAAGSLAALAATAGDSGATGAYLAFAAAIGLWGAQEILFLTGWVTGPWRVPCPAGLGGWAKAGYALRAILYHELALLGSGAAALVATAGSPNQTGVWTFAILLVMRVSAKLNVFLGVPNLTDGFLPSELAYLKSFFSRKPMNLLFPVSVTACTVTLILLCQRVGDTDATASVLLATLVALGLLEHWFLVLPLPVEALWNWGLASRSPVVETATANLTASSGLGTVIRLEPHTSVVTSASASGPLPSTRNLRTVALRPVERARRRP